MASQNPEAEKSKTEAKLPFLDILAIKPENVKITHADLDKYKQLKEKVYSNAATTEDIKEFQQLQLKQSVRK